MPDLFLYFRIEASDEISTELDQQLADVGVVVPDDVGAVGAPHEAIRVGVDQVFVVDHCLVEESVPVLIHGVDEVLFVPKSELRCDFIENVVVSEVDVRVARHEVTDVGANEVAMYKEFDIWEGLQGSVEVLMVVDTRVEVNRKSVCLSRFER